MLNAPYKVLNGTYDRVKLNMILGCPPRKIHYQRKNFVAGNVSPCNDADFQCLNNKIKFVIL